MESEMREPKPEELRWAPSAVSAPHIVPIPQALWMQCARFDREIFGPDAWAESVWKSELANPDRLYLMIQENPAPHRSIGRLLALGGISLYEDCELLTLAVAPSVRRRGYATSVLLELIDAARAAGSKQMFLEVRAHDTGAQRLYAHFGFERLGVRKRYYSDDDALTMRLSLKESDA